MRSSRIHLILSVLVFSLLLASPAFANNVKMTYYSRPTGSGIGGGSAFCRLSLRVLH